MCNYNNLEEVIRGRGVHRSLEQSCQAHVVHVLSGYQEAAGGHILVTKPQNGV